MDCAVENHFQSHWNDNDGLRQLFRKTLRCHSDYILTFILPCQSCEDICVSVMHIMFHFCSIDLQSYVCKSKRAETQVYA